MFEALGIGVALGLSSGLAPGPLLALVVSQTVRHGFAQGLRVALAPLISDLPIVLGATILVGTLAGSQVVLGLVSIAGALVVASIARETWRATLPDAALATGAPDSWRQGVVVNLLNPHPYLFWLTVGAPALVAASRGGLLPSLGFVVGFYVCLVGSKVLVAWLTARAGLQAGSRAYRLVMRVLAVVLAGFSVVLLVDGLGRLELPIALPFGAAVAGGRVGPYGDIGLG